MPPKFDAKDGRGPREAGYPHLVLVRPIAGVFRVVPGCARTECDVKRSTVDPPAVLVRKYDAVAESALLHGFLPIL